MAWVDEANNVLHVAGCPCDVCRFRATGEFVLRRSGWPVKVRLGNSIHFEGGDDSGARGLTPFDWAAQPDVFDVGEMD